MGSHQKYRIIADRLMGREPPPKPARARPRAPASPVATIGDLLRSHSPKWFWAYCLGRQGGSPCCYVRPIPLAPFAIRWGMDASSDMIRRNLVCTRCGHRGVQMVGPSANGLGERGDFPTDQQDGAV